MWAEQNGDGLKKNPIPVDPFLDRNIPSLPESDQRCSIPVNKTNVQQIQLHVQQKTVDRNFSVSATDHQSP